MFEKEAEEILNNHCDCELLSECMTGIRCRCSDFEESKKLLIEGIEFGYNKANELHYVKDELPPEDVPLLCVRGGRLYVAWYYNGVYHDSRCSQVRKPYAWKEIVLPELKEN